MLGVDGLHILVVEDSQVYQLLLSSIFSDAAGSVSVTPSGAQAKEMVQQGKYDCILLDLNLEDGDGLGCIEHFHEYSPQTAIIILTGDDNEQRALAALQLGAEDYLVKGEFSNDALKRCIRYAVERKKNRLENFELNTCLLKEREMNALQKQFVSMVTHEFRTPLAIIDSSMQLMQALMPTEERVKLQRHHDKIMQAIKRMTGLIDHSLTFTRVDDGVVSYLPVPFHLAEMIKRLVDNYAENYGRKIEIQGDTLPDIFMGDAKLCEHIFTNIIGNAMKYSPADSVVKIICRMTASEMFLDVLDDGIGIPTEELRMIGNKFFRAKNAIGTAGTGVGIYLTQQFMQLHGGSLYVQSKQGRGTRVTLTFPLKLKEPLATEETTYDQDSMHRRRA